MTEISKRAFLKNLGAITTTAAMGAPTLAQALPIEITRNQREPLSTLAPKAKLLFGASIASEGLQDPAYGLLYKKETNIITTDLALKFDNLRPTESTIDFSDADATLAFARSANLLMRGHTLIWNQNLPSWLKSKSKTEIAKIFDQHIDTVAARYAGKLHSWDVVNEAIWPDHGQPMGLRDGPWLQALGADYIARAFKRVYAIDKTARLCLNEAHCEILNSWGAQIRPRLLELVDRLLQQGVPVHAVGLQAHLQPQWAYNDNALEDFVRQLATRKVDIYITEMDVNDDTYANGEKIRDARVADRYAQVLSRLLRIPAVKMVVTWQLSDLYSGYRKDAIASNPSARRLPRPLLFDEKMERKPAWTSVANALQQSDVVAAGALRR
jgi:endo-1,4-beta-xylanase